MADKKTTQNRHATRQPARAARRSPNRKSTPNAQRASQRPARFAWRWLYNGQAYRALRQRLPPWADEAGGIALVVMGVLALAALLNTGEGLLAVPLAHSLAQVFGYGAYLVCLSVIGLGLTLLLARANIRPAVNWSQILALEVGFVAVEGLLHLLSFTSEPRALVRAGGGGGYVGWAVANLITSFMGTWPAIGALSLTLIISGLILTGARRRHMRQALLALGHQLQTWASQLEDVSEASPPEQTVASGDVVVEEVGAATSSPPPAPPGRRRVTAILPDGRPAPLPATPDGPLLAPLGSPHVTTVTLEELNEALANRATSTEVVLSDQSPANDTAPQSPLQPGQDGAGEDTATEYRTLVINGETVQIPLDPRADAGPSIAQPSIITEAQRRRLEGRRYFTVDGFQDRYKWDDERDPILPPLELLRYADLKLPDEDEINTNAHIIENTMTEFDIRADVIDVRIGPTVTQYAVSPIKEVVNDEGEVEIIRTRVNKIANLASDFALALSTKRLRIQAPVPGYSYVGIEVPNREPSLVSLRSVLETEKFYRKRRYPLAVPLGRDVSGDPIITDLATLPHLLVAGTTGSGKSVCLTSVITALVTNNTPRDVRLILLDPKMVELSRFNGLPHLLGPVETETERIIGVLRWAAREMDRRYKLLEMENARNLEAYNEMVGDDRPEERLPYIVIAVDEIGDLMMSRPDETEKTLTRLAQKARAAGMHLIVATQRPSVDVITGLIKANFPARLSFAVASGTDSRVILDTTGAETLVGRGDLLFLSPDAPAPVRLQGCYISDEEIYEIVMYWQALQEELVEEGKMESPETRVSPWEQSLTRLEEKIKLDPILEDALQMVVAEGRASVSQIQKRMGIDYPRAARLMDSLRDLGIVGGTLAGGRNRKVLVKSVEEARRMIHNNRRKSQH